MAGSYTYRNLIVWDRAQELALVVIQITQRFPNSWANAIMARQIISAATSIGANIAEGHGRYTPGAHRNHLSIAKGSTAETDSWLDLLRRVGSITPEEEAPLHAECTEIISILTRKILDLDDLERKSSSKVREQPENYNVQDALNEPPFPFVPGDYRILT